MSDRAKQFAKYYDLCKLPKWATVLGVVLLAFGIVAAGAIIAMPEKDFYNTGIGTYIWIVTNRKEARRKGKVQLVDATSIKTPLRKNLGEKNCETNETFRNFVNTRVFQQARTMV